MKQINIQSFFEKLSTIYGDSNPFGGGLIHNNLASVELTREDLKLLGENIFLDLLYDDDGEVVKVITQENTYNKGEKYPVQIRVGVGFRKHIEPRASLGRVSLKKLTDLVRSEIYGGKNADQYACHKEAKDPEPSNPNTNCNSFEDSYLLAKDVIKEYASKKQQEEYKSLTINFGKKVAEKAAEKFSKLLA